MKRRYKTIPAVVLSAAMIFSTCFAAYAAEPEEISPQESYENETSEDNTGMAEFDEPRNDLSDVEDTDSMAESLETSEADETEETLSEQAEDEKEQDMNLETLSGVNAGTQVSGYFDAVSGMDITSVRFYTNQEKTDYDFADFEYSEISGRYEYSFIAPYNGFEITEGTQTCIGNEECDANIVAAYYNLNVWDGAVDVSWYDASLSEYHIYTPAQLAGVAAVTNGCIDSVIHDYNVKGFRSDMTGADNNGLPDCVRNEYVENTSLGGPVSGPAHLGLQEYDFRDKLILLEADMNMGGASGSVLASEGIYEARANLHDGTHEGYDYYPNWTPIGGLFCRDVNDLSTVNKAFFNGSFDGQGHNIYNLYCYRWSYPKPGTTAYGYADSTGLIGKLGYLYTEDEPQPVIAPAVRNLGLDGFIMGRRSVGAFVGMANGGTYYQGDIYFENLANHATVYSTDSKGVAGIVGSAWNPSGYIVNCYNTGVIRQYEYDGPAGGIVGQNEGFNIYCCYNTGMITTTSKKGRGIGANDSGKNYTVDDCYYLEGHYDCDVERYFGYYFENAASSVSIDVTRISATQVTDGTLLSSLNVNGTAYAAGDNGYPVLLWEAGAQEASFSLMPTEGGTVTSSIEEGTYPAGTIVYLGNTSEEGWSFRYYTLNNDGVHGSYVTLYGNSEVSAYYQSSGVGYIEIPNNPVCEIHVYKVTQDAASQEYIYTEIRNGDAIMEGDVITVEASIREGVVPADHDYEYKSVAGLEQPFCYKLTYNGYDPEEDTYIKTFTVSDKINAENAYLTLQVVAEETEKMWKYLGDTEWYEEGRYSFTINTPYELAGLDALVESGITFAGVTITLGNDISLTNPDGSDGNRYWDGIGNQSTAFSGAFDGAGHKITDIKGSSYGLFARCKGVSRTERCVVKNVDVYGANYGYNASGIAGYIYDTDVLDCDNYCVIDGSSQTVGYNAGIAGEVSRKSTIKRCNNYGPVSGNKQTGGIAGAATISGTDCAVIEDCLNFGEITSAAELSTAAYTGGIAGYSYGATNRCANYGEISSKALYSGGVLGYSRSAGGALQCYMTDCYNAGRVAYTGTKTTAAAGGLIGNAQRFIVRNSFNYGEVALPDGLAAYCGAFAGTYTPYSSDKTANVYCLDDGTLPILKNMTYDELLAYIDETSAGDINGIYTANETGFADEQGVLAAVNANGVFVLTNGRYPELEAVSEAHVHTGGTATCSTQAVCEICGLHYGALDPDNHEETELRNVLPAEWMQDGYSGDVYCKGCQELISTGELIPVDTTREILNVKVIRTNETLLDKMYTVAEFDAIKSTGPVGYQYGAELKVIVGTNRYVTIENLLNSTGHTMDELESVYIQTEGSFELISKERLFSENLFYNQDGSITTVPASIGIYYNSGNGDELDINKIVEGAVYSPLKLLYGIKQADIENGTVGGFRLIAPVILVKFNLISEGAASPVITKQPEDTSGGIGSAISFSLAAENAASYQWYYSKDNGAKWYKSSATGNDTDTLTLTVKANNKDNIYRCKVTGTDGTVITSDSAGLKAGLVIIRQPKDATGTIGSTVSYNVIAQNAESYQWYYSKDNGAKWYKSSASGADTDTLTLTVKANNKDNLYRCKVTGTDSTVIVSDSAGLKEGLVIIQQPEDAYGSLGSIVTFSVIAQGVETYQWYYSKDNGAKWYKSSASGADTDTLTLTVKTNNKDNIYRCKITGNDGTNIYTDTVKTILQ